MKQASRTPTSYPIGHGLVVTWRCALDDNDEATDRPTERLAITTAETFNFSGGGTRSATRTHCDFPPAQTQSTADY